MGLSDGRKSVRIGLAVLIQYRSVTDTHPASHPARHVAVAITLNAKASSLKTSLKKPDKQQDIITTLVCEQILKKKKNKDKAKATVCKQDGCLSANRSRVSIRGRPCKIFLRSSLITMQNLVAISHTVFANVGGPKIFGTAGPASQGWGRG